MITVSDGYLTASGILNAVIEPVNDAPWLALPELMSFAEDESLNIDLSQYSGDVDGDLLTYTVASSELIIYQTGSIIDLSAATNWFGAAEVEINVSDGIERITITDTLDINVSPVNDAPELILPDSISFNEDESYELDLSDYAYDVDGDELVLTLCRSELILESEGLIVTISAPANWNGEENLEICIEDDEIEVCDQMQVTVSPINDAPELELPADLEFMEDGELIIDIGEYSNDIDGDVLSLNAESMILILDWEGLELQITAPPDWYGETDITITILDGNGGETTGNIAITVENVNDYPVINLPASFTFAEDENLTIHLSQYCSDVDGDELEYSVNSEVIIASITDSLLFLSAPLDWNGSEVIAISIDDGQVRVESSDLTTIIVSPINDTPVLDLPSEIVFDEDNTYILDLSENCYDVDGDSLILEYNQNMNNISIGISGFILTFNSTANWYGTELAEFTLSDGAGGVSEGTISVIVEPVNDPPQSNLPDSLSFAEDSEYILDLSLYITDIDSDYLEYYIESDTLITQMDGTELIISSPQNWYGMEIITIIIDDQEQRIITSDDIIINVTPVNDAPWLDLPEALEMMQGESIMIDISSYGGDIDSDSLQIYVESEIIDYEVDDMQITLTAPVDWSGMTLITVTLSDGQAAANDFINITVNNNSISLSYDLVQNWNWISFNTFPEDAGLNNILDELEGVAEQIKAQNISSTWFSGYGWVGQLTELEAGKMYLLKMTDDFEDFTVTGEAADPQMPISLTADWNWIGHLPQDPIPLTDLMITIEPNAIQIKTQNISSTWFASYGWVGQLNVLEPGVGYKLKMAQPDTLTYPDTRQYPEDILLKNKTYLWNTAKGFENNMTLLASIEIDQYEDRDIIQAGYFDDADICHGAGEYIDDLGLWYFTIAGNEEGELLQLRLLMADGQEYICDPVIEFCNNAILGEPDLPEIFSILVTDHNNNEIPEITSLGQSYPNPCLIDQQRMNLNISYSIAEPGKIKLNIYNCKGQLVRRLINKDQEPGSFTINWDGRDERGNCVSAGVYLYQLNASKRIYNRKLLLLR